MQMNAQIPRESNLDIKNITKEIDNAEVGSSSLPPATRILSILILFAYRF
jgi:hypothetical protein